MQKDLDEGSRFYDQPTLNSPYEYPTRHWELLENGQPTNRIIDQRRDVSFITPIPKPKKSILFPKPPRANPIPLDEWLIRTDRAESGREAFFRGRDMEYGVLQSALTSLSKGTIGGGTMIFQGAPGAGKSALMAECMEAVRRHSTPEDPWVAVSIPPGSLRFPDRVVRALVTAANTEGQRLREQTSGTAQQMLGKCLDMGRQFLRELPDRGLTVGGLSLGQREREVSADGLFEHVAPLLQQFHLVVCVDEAQNTPVSQMTRDVLDCLHRDPQGIPLVAAFFGLSDTQAVLRECGLSRFADERIVHLEPLRSEDAACAIRDSLVHYGFPGSVADLTVWVDRLTKLSQGWPQHINRVSVATMRVLRDHSGHFVPSLLELALERGQERKEEYYAGRLAAGSQYPMFYQQIAQVADSHPDGIVTHQELQQLASSFPESFRGSIDDFITSALHAGLLTPVKNLPFHYRIPIPSLGDYLRTLPVSPK